MANRALDTLKSLGDNAAFKRLRCFVIVSLPRENARLLDTNGAMNERGQNWVTFFG
jgi:hypothetical protein